MLEATEISGSPLKVVIFSSVPPRQVARIIARIRRDAPETQVCGVLYERRSPKTLKQRIEIWRKKMTRFLYWRYVIHRVGATIDRHVYELLDRVIRFIHAAPRWPNGKPGLRARRPGSRVQGDGRGSVYHSQHSFR